MSWTIRKRARWACSRRMAAARVALSAGNHTGAAFSAAAWPSPPQKSPRLGVRSRHILSHFGGTGAMVLFWCSAITGDILRYNSRFGVFNSRLGRRKFPFPLLRELTSKGSIYLAVSPTKTTVIAENRENSRFHRNNREFCRHRRNGRRRALQRRRSALLRRSSRRLLTARVQPIASGGVPRTQPRRACHRYRFATVTPSPPLYYLNAPEH